MPLATLALALLTLLTLLWPLAPPASAASIPENAAEVGQGALGEVDARIAGAPAAIAQILRHPEFERYALRWPDGAATVLEITLARPGHEGACEAGGAALYPRPELREGAAPDPQAEAALIEAACARLIAAPPDFANPPPEVGAEDRAPGGPPPPGRSVGSRPFGSRTAGLPWWLPWLVVVPGLVGWRGGRHREVAGIVGWSIAACLWRLWVVAPGIFNGGNAGYEKIQLALSAVQGNPYGDGHGWLLAPAFALLGRDPAAVFAGTLAWSSLSVGLAWAWIRAELGGRAAAAVALLWLLLPVPVMLSRSEELSVPVVALGLIALRAAVQFRHVRKWGAAWIAAWALGLAVHVRPEAALLIPACAVAALPTPWAWRRTGALIRQSAPRAAPGIALLGLALWLRLPLDGGQQVLQWENLLSLSAWADILRPTAAATPPPFFQLALHLQLTPPILPALALLGLWAIRWRERVRWLLVWAALTLPVVIKAWPLADAIRLQHAALLPWVFLAGAGFAWLSERAGLLRAGIVLAVGLSLSAAKITQPQPGWINHQEYAFLAEHVPGLSVEDRVIAPLSGPRLERLREVAASLGPAQWQLSTPDHPVAPAAGDLLWRGAECGTAAGAWCRQILAGCGTEPVITQTLAPKADLDVEIVGPVEIGFFRVTGCGAP